MGPITDLNGLLRLSRDSISNPRGAASVLLRDPLPRDALWLLFCLIIVSSMFFGELMRLVLSSVEGLAQSVPGPIASGVIQGLVLTGMAIAVHRIGRYFGGHGSFDQTLQLVTFHQFVLMIVQGLALLLLFVFPPFGYLLQVVSLALGFWLLVNFIAELHGFTSLGKVLGGVLLVSLVVFFAVDQIMTSMSSAAAP